MNITKHRFFRSLFLLTITTTLTFHILRAEETNSTPSDNCKTISISVTDRNVEKEVILHPGQELTINITPEQSSWNSLFYATHSNCTMNSDYDLDDPNDYEISYHLLENINKNYRDSWVNHCNLEEERNLNTDRPEMSYHFKARESGLINEELPKKFCVELFSVWHGYEMQAHTVNFLKVYVTIE
ncbi:MAG: hypothetical protein ACH346_03865 [Chthoniobacterales bacterium]